MKILRRHFANGFFEIGSGVCLQPLLRFSDRFSAFLFVDFALDGREAQAALRAALDDLRASGLGEHEPLTLEGMVLDECMQVSDFELALPVSEVLPRARHAFGESDVEGLGYFGQQVSRERPQQWGLEASLVRKVRLVGGATRSRALTLRLVGGEGLLTFVGMGGLDAPPSFFATVQTGVAELSDGPFADLFRRQHALGKPIPEIWVRGSRPLAPHGPGVPASFEAAGPYVNVAQDYSGWWGDARRWTHVDTQRRAVRAWAADEWVAPSPLCIAQHRIVPEPLTRTELFTADSVCMGMRLGMSLGLDAGGRYELVPGPELGRAHEPLSRHLERWASSDGFRRAGRAVFVPSGFEDEVEVIVDWLRQVSGPEVHVHLPRRLDFEAVERTLAATGPT